MAFLLLTWSATLLMMVGVISTELAILCFHCLRLQIGQDFLEHVQLYDSGSDTTNDKSNVQ